MLADLLFLVSNTGNSQMERILKPEIKNLLNLLLTFSQRNTKAINPVIDWIVLNTPINNLHRV